MSLDDPERFKNEQLLQYQDKLSSSDFHALIEEQKKMRSPPAADRLSFKDKIKAWVQTNGLKDKNAGAFTAAAIMEYENRTGGGKKALSSKDEDQLLDSLLLKGKTGSNLNPLNWFGESETAATYQESVRTGKPFVPEISAQDRALIVQSFARRGVTKPTEEQIVDAYKRAKGIR
jgi:hypothetical protein